MSTARAAGRALLAVAMLAAGTRHAAPQEAALPPLARAGQKAVEVRRPLAPDGLLRLWNLAGSIHVVAWDRDSLVISGQAGADVPFFCGGSGRALKCATDIPPREEDQAGEARLEVRVPRRATVWLKSASAEISVEGIGGDLDAYTVTGRVRVEGAGRNIAVETMGGDIQVAASATTMRLRSAGGSITVTGAAEDLDASTVSGDIVLEGGRVRRGRMESIEGSVRWRGALAPGAALELTSHSGPIELRLPAATRGEFLLSSYQGALRNDFGPSRLPAGRDLAGRELSFTLPPPGNTRVTVRNFKGSIALLRD